MSVVLVVGGGKVGSHLAGLLVEGGNRVTVVEADEERAARLGQRLGQEVAVWGSGTDAVLLERSGARGCDVVAAVTGTDETNLVVASLAKFEFGVPRTIARIVDPRNAWMFESDMGVDAALNQGDILAHLVAEEMSLGEMTILLKLRRGQYALVEERVERGSPVAGRKLGEVKWPPRCRIVALIRAGELMTPEPDVALAPTDEILAVVHTGSVTELSRLLAATEHPGSPSSGNR